MKIGASAANHVVVERSLVLEHAQIPLLLTVETIVPETQQKYQAAIQKIVQVYTIDFHRFSDIDFND